MTDNDVTSELQRVQSACAITYTVTIDELGKGDVSVSNFLRIKLTKLAAQLTAEFPEKEIRVDFVPLILGNLNTEEI